MAPLLVVASYLAWTSPPATGFPLQDDNTPGAMAMAYKRQSNMWSRLDLGFVDATEKSSPPDSTKYDRRLELFSLAGFDLAVSPRFGFRLNAKADVVKRRQAEIEDPKTVVDEQIKTYSPSADITFVTEKGLEIVAGALVRVTSAYDQNVTAGDITSKTAYRNITNVDRRVGVVRRAGAWTGGVFYSFGSDSKRGYEKTASDGSSVAGDEDIFIPSRFSVFGSFAAAATIWDFELSFIQARGKGPKNENGATLQTDSFDARLGGNVPFGAGIGLKTTLSHQTLSYASNAFMTMETIPVTSLKTLLFFGDEKGNAYLGLIFAHGKDRQSLPEFNATYELNAAAITSGFMLPL